MTHTNKEEGAGSYVCAFFMQWMSSHMQSRSYSTHTIDRSKRCSTQCETHNETQSTIRTNELTHPLKRYFFAHLRDAHAYEQSKQQSSNSTQTCNEPVNTLHETMHTIRHETNTHDKPMSVCFTMIERLRQHQHSER